MNTVLYLLIWQGALGAYDAIRNHEWKEDLPNTPAAFQEQWIHGARELLLGSMFIGLAWYTWHGPFAWAIFSLLAAEIVLTGWDYLVEEKTRVLSPNETVLHFLLSMGGGACAALLIPQLLQWSNMPGGVASADYGLISWALTLFGTGAFIWGVRDCRSAVRLARLPHAAPAIHMNLQRETP